MFRSRSIRVLLLLGAMAGIVYLLISLFLPSSRRLILGVDKSTGKVRLVRGYVTFLPPFQFYRLSFDRREGAAQRDGLVQILSREKVPVTVSYRLRFNVAGDKIEDARTLVRDGWNAWIRSRIGEAISAVTQQVPIEELLSPTSQFSAQRGALRNVVARHLAQSGLQVSAFEIARMEPDRNALLAYKRAEVRRNARGVAGRVAIFAIDGADWELLSELSDDGRIPNIAALAKNGVTANLQSIQPTVSPLVWATAATGVAPDRHGVIDFLDRAQSRPVDATARRSPAIWEIAEAFGRHSTVVNWWTTWPPLPAHADEPTTTLYDTPVVPTPQAIYPARHANRVARLIVPAQTVGYGQAGRFLNITAKEFEDAIGTPGANDPVEIFRDTLAKTWSDHRVAMELYQADAPLLFMMSFDGTDTVNHLFAPYHPPYREGMDSGNFRKYWPTVANYYSEVDRLIGEWMKVLTDDTTVMIVSAHGFRWGKTRPRVQPLGRAALSDHRGTGVFIAFGNHVNGGRRGFQMSIYDLAPTVLAILGLPKSSEMPGNVATWAINNVSPVESVRVISYSEFFGPRPVGATPGFNAQTYTKTLQGIGHLLDPSRGMEAVFEDEDGQERAPIPLPPDKWGLYAHWNNTGVDLRRQNKLADAVDAFQAAIDLNPNHPTPYLNMAMTLFDRQQYTAADNVFIMAVQKGLPNADRWFIDFAALYRSRDMPSRAIQLLYQGKKIFPQSYAIAANLGSALAQSSRYTEGLPELERALGMQPSSTLVLNNLGLYYSKKNDYARALDFWNRSLTIDPRQTQIRGAADAARTRL
jgi:predicted AlkP superfamily phosphohydrolase/phosphomutase/Tfp pilus assembly protein PilF